jgi:hypothetical protein
MATTDLQPRQCSKCQETKTRADFPRGGTKSDGLSSWCRVCHAAYNKLNKKKHAAYHAEYREKNKDKILAYNRSDRGKAKRRRHRFSAKGKITAMLVSARERARDRGIDFDLTAADIVIPTHCPVLGIPVTFPSRSRDHAISLDRVDLGKGYIKGNIVVVSMRANRFKSDATIEELKQLYEFYSKLTL